jgi:peptidoglycan/LPS O-acetylase OafA/YrhL
LSRLEADVVLQKKGLSAFFAIFLVSLILLWAAKRGINQHDNAYAIARCFSGFFLGAILCAVTRALGPQVDAMGTVFQLIVLILAGVVVSVADYSMPNLQMALPFVFAAVVGVLVIYPRSSVVIALSSPVMRWIGKLSYSIYMSHMFIIVMGLTVLRVVFKLHVVDGNISLGLAPSLFIAAGFVVVTLIVSEITFRFVEHPFDQMGKRLFPRR